MIMCDTCFSSVNKEGCVIPFRLMPNKLASLTHFATSESCHTIYPHTVPVELLWERQCGRAMLMYKAEE